jgi:hypothetical protein
MHPALKVGNQPLDSTKTTSVLKVSNQQYALRVAYFQAFCGRNPKIFSRFARFTPPPLWGAHSYGYPRAPKSEVTPLLLNRFTFLIVCSAT